MTSSKIAKVAINGFGRIGRLVLRAFFENNEKKYNFAIDSINDLQDIDTAIYLFKYDSVHGKFRGTVEKISENELAINGQRIFYSSERNPEKLPWREREIKLVLECSGIFKTKQACGAHLAAGAEKVLLSCPSEEADKTVVWGVNQQILCSDDKIVSNASCTTNCVAPVIKVVNDEFGILNGNITTIHSYTSDQRLVDAAHHNLRRARAAALNIIPTSTGVAKTIGKIFPKLQGKIVGRAFRVPSPDVSLADLLLNIDKKISADEAVQAFKKYGETDLRGVLEFTEDPLVSCDFLHSSASSTVDLNLIEVIDGNLLHIVAWYDNEWGFSNRMLDTASILMEV